MNKILLSALFISAGCVAEPQNEFFVKPEHMHLIKQAFATYSGGAVAPSYYTMKVNGQRMRGERPWEVRWNLVKDTFDYKGKRVLDLGCNIGLLNACLQKYYGAAFVMNVDAPQAFLEKQNQTNKLNAARWIAQAFEVPFHLRQFDFNLSNDYEKQIGYDYDIVYCMSLLHWLTDAGRMVRYLSNFNNVIVEGVGDAQSEIDRFEKEGFSYAILGVVDKGRTVIHFFK